MSHSKWMRYSTVLKAHVLTQQHRVARAADITASQLEPGLYGVPVTGPSLCPASPATAARGSVGSSIETSRCISQAHKQIIDINKELMQQLQGAEQ